MIPTVSLDPYSRIPSPRTGVVYTVNCLLLLSSNESEIKVSRNYLRILLWKSDSFVLNVFFFSLPYVFTFFSCCVCVCI